MWNSGIIVLQDTTFYDVINGQHRLTSTSSPDNSYQTGNLNVVNGSQTQTHAHKQPKRLKGRGKKKWREIHSYSCFPMYITLFHEIKNKYLYDRLSSTTYFICCPHTTGPTTMTTASLYRLLLMFSGIQHYLLGIP